MKNKVARKITTLWQVIKFFYGRYTKEALLRDFIFVFVITAEMTGIAVGGKFLDATVSYIQNTQVFDFTQYVSTDSFYFLALGLFLWFISNIGYKIRQNLYDNINDKLNRDSEFSILDKVAKSNMQDVNSDRFQYLLTYIPNYCVDNMMQSYGAFSDIISGGVKLAAAISIMFVNLHWSVIILVLFVLPEVLLGHFGRKKISIYNDSQVYRLGYISYVYSLALDFKNFPELRVDNSYDYITRTYKEEKDSYLRGLFFRRKHYWIDNIFGSVSDQLFKYIYVIYILAYTIKNKLSIGSFTALFNYADVVYSTSLDVLNTVSQLDSYLWYSEMFFEFQSFKGFGDLEHGDVKLKENTPSLEFQSLDFAYPDNPKRKILENVSFKIEPGEKVVFFGGDGSGKSSLIKVLTGLYEIVAGDYVIDGYSVRELERGELKRKLSVTFQNFVNYNFSVERNVTLTSNRKNINRKLYKKVLKIAGIDEILEKDGLSDKQILGVYVNGGRELSPGYWQRLAIARMLYRNKEVFVMDEPFTFIDGPSRYKILKGIMDFVGPDRTLIYITRNTDDLELFDRIYYFENGHISETGNWKELMQKKGKLYKDAKYNR